MPVNNKSATLLDIDIARWCEKLRRAAEHWTSLNIEIQTWNERKIKKQHAYIMICTIHNVDCYRISPLLPGRTLILRATQGFWKWRPWTATRAARKRWKLCCRQVATDHSYLEMWSMSMLSIVDLFVVSFSHALPTVSDFPPWCTNSRECAINFPLCQVIVLSCVRTQGCLIWKWEW